MQKKLLLRRSLIGAFGALVYVVRCPVCIIIMDADNNSKQNHNVHDDDDNDRPSNKKQYKVYSFDGSPALPLQNSSSAKLVPALEGEEHDAEVIWTARAKATTDALASAAAESMWIRLRRRGRIKSTAAETPDFDQLKATLTNFTQDELNGVDPGWKIFILDGSDQGIGVWPYYFMEHVLSPLIGWGRVNYAERTTQTGRDLGGWVTAMITEKDPALPFDGYVGTPVNYTEYLDRRAFNSMQRLHLSVRVGFAEAVAEYVREKHPEEYGAAYRSGDGDTGADLRLSAAIAHRLPRPTDVRNFWNAAWCNHQCKFRNRIAEIVDTLPERHVANITTSTEVMGQIHGAGRRNLNPGYLEGLMTTKIVVLAQRDGYEDQVRFDEALLSGALVLADLQIYWPHGVVDGENVVAYRSWSDLEFKILYYLENEEERATIGLRGRELALTYHRSWQQAERLFLNDMTYKNEYGVLNKPWRWKYDFAF